MKLFFKIKNKESKYNDKAKNRRNALIIFTREPEPGMTKTRLMPRYTPEQCAELHECFLRDIASEARRADADIFVAYTGGQGAPVLRSIFPEVFKEGRAFEQKGEGLGERMENALAHALGTGKGVSGKTGKDVKQRAAGYEKAVLIGTDIPELRAESMDAAFRALDGSDIVLGPTADGGYYLIGMKEVHHEAFDVKLYGTSSVFEETAESIRRSGLTVGQADAYSDIDEPEDIEALRDRLSRTAVNDGRIRGGRPAKIGRKAEPEGKVYRTAETAGFLSRTAGISVIIPVYNEAETVESMIGQLAPFSEELEIIFVDGGSTDGTAGILEETAASAGRTVLTASQADTCSEADEPAESAEPNGGFIPGFRLLRSAKGRGRQMNFGAESSHGDILFFLHCDSVLPEGFTEEMRACIAGNPYGCFGVSFPSRNLFMLTNRLISNHRACVRGLPFGDQGIFIDRSLFFGMGMFPETEIMEDYEFALRLRRRGYRPAMTARRIETSVRRYGGCTADILRTELAMWKLRRMFRRGADPARLAEKYRDIR